MKLDDIKKIITEVQKESTILLESPTHEKLNESPLSRVKDTIENKNIPFAMLTAHRGVDKDLLPAEQDRQRAENNKNQDRLKARLKASGFPWVDMRRSGYKQGGPEGEVMEEYSVLAYEAVRGDVTPSGKSLFDTARTLAADWSMIDNKKTQFKEMYDKWSAFKPKSKLEAMKKQHYLKLAESKIRG